MSEDRSKSNNFQRTQNQIIWYLAIGSAVPGTLIANAAWSASVPLSGTKNEASIAVVEIGKTDRAIESLPAKSNKISQANGLSDITRNWAEPFIRVLVTKGIIKGYPDGTFKPNQLVTRAEFAALLDRTFNLAPIKPTKKFADVPSNHWAAQVIQKAYQSGFLAGYANDIFAPDKNILRVESLVSVINGNKIEPMGTLDLDGVFSDASQIPSYGKNAVVAATQRCVVAGVDYDNNRLPGGNLNPSVGATRADMAALIHQILVSAGQLSPLEATNRANQHIASCPQGVYAEVGKTAPSEPPPPEAVEPPVTESSSNYSNPNPFANFSFPVGGVNSPSAFGANWGEVFLAAGYQNSTRPQIFNDPNARTQGTRDGTLAFGFGLGNSRSSVGLELFATSNSTVRRGFFNEGAVSFKLHKQLNDNFALAVGVDDAIAYGVGSDIGSSYYGVASMVLNPSPNLEFLSNTTVSIGVGNGRYRSVGDVRLDRSTYGVFGSIGTRLSPNVSLVTDWDGQDLGIGVPVAFPLGSNLSIQVMPAVVDLVNPETGGRRFTLSAGIGLNF
jgi:hypothetical protein